MKVPKVLITSFDTWRSHHTSNSSDDLITKVLQQGISALYFSYLRKIPVDFKIAPEKVIFAIEQLQPEIMICCGMAEGRKFLTVESQAVNRSNTIRSKVKIKPLIKLLPFTRISHNAGGFVCNRTYYVVLEHLTKRKLEVPCIFVHVPILTDQNSVLITNDFLAIADRMINLLA